jgi:hypothetical protein
MTKKLIAIPEGNLLRIAATKTLTTLTGGLSISRKSRKPKPSPDQMCERFWTLPGEACSRQAPRTASTQRRSIPIRAPSSTRRQAAISPSARFLERPEPRRAPPLQGPPPAAAPLFAHRVR